MRFGTGAVLAFAIVAGGLATLMARSALSPQNLAKPSVKIVVASKPLHFGMALSNENLAEIDWGAAVPPEGSFPSIQAMSKDGARVALASFGKNEPIIAGRVSGPGQRASLAALLDPGMRAVTVRVDDVKGVAGFIMPGDRVDVMLTRTEDGQSFTDILLQNVKVLAIDQVANERQESARVARAVTLEATMQQGQKLVLAGGAGVLSLILRQSESPDVEAPRRVSLTDLAQSETAAVPKTGTDDIKTATVPPAPPPATVKVTIIRGAATNDVEVQQETR
ncbi:MAG: Flp pilus assembly protein CpaB [Methylocystis sp.]|nr:Flp pilus assembly protein CpaB [Methylocystis sp.]